MNLIKSILQGVPIPSIIVNNRDWESDNYRIAVIDGKQRITSILNFLGDSLAVPGEWFGVDMPFVHFGDLPIEKQRHFRQSTLAFSEGQLRSIEEEQYVFELVNFGGVPQGQKDEI